MTTATDALVSLLSHQFPAARVTITPTEEIELEFVATDLLKTAEILKTNFDFAFEQLLDLTCIDYLHYGQSEWNTTSASSTGFDRGVRRFEAEAKPQARFAMIYLLLSISHNQRLRLKTWLSTDPPQIESVIPVWQSANWYEREVFDLYGILFMNHPDLRRILTDYGFVGHPLRKDFPLIGHVEMRFDKQSNRVIYEPVSIENRTLVPKVIREDSL